jgi:O-antigen/teichoic acid export membrane protein
MNTPTVLSSDRRRRSTLLRLAIYSSGCSKVTALLLHSLAIPLVYRSLGSHQYALFVLLSGVLGTISLLQMGAGPGLTRELARAHAEGNLKQETSIFGAAIIFSIFAAGLGTAGVVVAVRLIPVNILFGNSFAGDQSEILRIATFCSVLLALYIVTGVADSALAGYQEQVFTGVSTTIANLVTTVVLYLVCSRSPSIAGVVFVLYGIPACSRLVNLVLLLWRRPYLIHCLEKLSTLPIALLMQTGTGFWLIQISSLVEQNAGAFIVAHFATPEAVAMFAIAFKIVGFAGSAVGIFTQPLWPSFTDAIVRRDLDWVVNVFQKIKLGLVSSSILAAATWVLFSNWIFVHFFHAAEKLPLPLTLVFATYLVANMWTHLHYISLMGIGNIWSISLVIFAENLLMVVLGLVFTSRWGATGMVSGYLLASLLLPFWLLPLMLSTRIKRIDVELATATDANHLVVQRCEA